MPLDDLSSGDSMSSLDARESNVTDTDEISVLVVDDEATIRMSLVEALEAGAGVVLLDEDTSATNFMIRDQRMQALVAKPQEPITPFVDRVRELRDRLGVSVVLVMGGSGDYFDHDLPGGDNGAPRRGRGRNGQRREPRLINR